MIGESELIINNDGSIFHLHMKPENLAEKIILVGDPGRVSLVASFFDRKETSTSNREFVSVTGTYNHQRITALSTGIGTDNIDIVINELDALANVDFNSRLPKQELTRLDIMRIGTSGGLQPNLPVNSFVVSQKSIGFDGILHFYSGAKGICNLEFEKALKTQLSWKSELPSPYVIDASEELLQKFDVPEFYKGINISAPGFYGPQGRVVRLPVANPEINRQLSEFNYKGFKITNYEMESSAIYGLSHLLGHRAITVCAVIANRITGKVNDSYHDTISKLVKMALDRFTD